MTAPSPILHDLLRELEGGDDKPVCECGSLGPNPCTRPATLREVQTGTVGCAPCVERYRHYLNLIWVPIQ